MDFQLSEDQQALQAAARGLLDELASPERVRRYLDSPAPLDADLWRAMADQGWLAGTLTEAAGGLGLGWVEAAVLLEELGRHAAPVPLLPTLVSLGTLSRAGRSDWVEPLLSGERVGAAVWAGGRVDAEKTGDGTWRLRGRAGLVEAAGAADVALVGTDEAVFGVDLEATGRPDLEPAMDVTRRLSWLTLDGAPATWLGGPDLAQDFLQRGATGASALLLGGASRVLDDTTQYAKDRVQFDQPIGSFQAVKHRCADMLVDVEGMRSATWYAAWSIDARADDSALAASAAKVWCSDAAARVMASGLQVHGGVGFTWDHDLHLYLKRAQFEGAVFGNASYHRERIAAVLGPGGGAH